MVEQEIKEDGRPRFIFEPRSVDEILKDDSDPTVFSDIDEFDRGMIVEDYGGVLRPIKNWSELNTAPELLKNIERSNYKKMRKIQSVVIPMILNGHDLKVQAETGSGKTCSFLIPIIHSVLLKRFASSTKHSVPSFNKPAAIIIEPTRELCIQVYEQCLKLARNTGVSVAICFGEYNYVENAKAVWKGCDILIATVGRLEHFCKEGVIDNKYVRYFVMDEADFLILDKSFEQIKAITNFPNFPENVQKLMFPATYSNKVTQHIPKILKPSFVYIHSEGEAAIPDRILQDFIPCVQCEKPAKLHSILDSELKSALNKSPRIMVFVRTRCDAEVLKAYLDNCQIYVLFLTGRLTAEARIRAMERYQSANPPIIITTDLCARGLDIKNLDMIINYGLPSNVQTYVHRVGRTGRLKFGRAVSLIDLKDVNDGFIVNELVALLKNQMYDVPPWLKIAATDVKFFNNKYITGFAQEASTTRANGFPGFKVALGNQN